MLDLEAQSGATWRELSEISYSATSILEENAPRWDELTDQQQLVIEIGLRQVQAAVNREIKTAEYWRDFVKNRLKMREIISGASIQRDRLR
jgi:hypothetical protein